MLRIVATASLDALLQARGIAADIRQRILRHGEVTVRRADGQIYLDILVDRDAEDLPDAAVTFLRNRAEVIYVAEWDGVSQTGTVLKGADPGIHKFAGWPV
jgi:hypothetical protein